jgi:hypothetical protein
VCHSGMTIRYGFICCSVLIDIANKQTHDLSIFCSVDNFLVLIDDNKEIKNVMFIDVNDCHVSYRVNAY